VDHGDAVGKAHEFVEVLGNQDDAGAAVAGGQEAFVNVGGGADVEAARRLGGEHDLRFGFQSPGEHDLLDIAAGQQPRRAVLALAADVIGLDQLSGMGAHGGEAQQAEALVLRLADGLYGKVFRNAHGADDAVMVAVFRDAGEADVDHLPGVGAGERIALERHAAGGGGLQTRDHPGQGRLTVAGDAGNAKDLAGFQVEVDIAQSVAPVAGGQRPSERTARLRAGRRTEAFRQSRGRP
jgi:hypothetical protein